MDKYLDKFPFGLQLFCKSTFALYLISLLPIKREIIKIFFIKSIPLVHSVSKPFHPTLSFTLTKNPSVKLLYQYHLRTDSLHGSFIILNATTSTVMKNSSEWLKKVALMSANRATQGLMMQIIIVHVGDAV